MDFSSHEGEIPIPINSAYGHVHMIHHHHPPPISHNHNNNNLIIPSSTLSSPPTTNGLPSTNPNPSPTALPPSFDHHNNIIRGSPSFEKSGVKYRECLKNHAAAMGGTATDGCGEFMPSGEEGNLEALTCSACNCHRNFHRKEVEGEPFTNNSYDLYTSGRKLFLRHHHPHPNPHPKAILPPPPPLQHHHHQQIVMPYRAIESYLPSESDEQEHHHNHHQVVKKRFRTKFTQEQKEKMLSFAERVGWKIQKQEEGVVQQFCQEIGVKRRVLKVWMHNNKHNLAKKSIVHPSSTSTA